MPTVKGPLTRQLLPAAQIDKSDTVEVAHKQGGLSHCFVKPPPTEGLGSCRILQP